MDPAALHRAGVDLARQTVAAIGDEQWSNPTPCRGWDVRTIVNHLTCEDLRAPHVMAGETPEQMSGRFAGDFLGEDPVAAHDAAAQAAMEVIEEPGALERLVHMPTGQAPGAVYVLARANDQFVHSWDIAVATGQPYQLAEPLAATLHDVIVPLVSDEVRAAGLFGPPVSVPADAPPFDHLLGHQGRDPGWRPRQP